MAVKVTGDKKVRRLLKNLQKHGVGKQPHQIMAISGEKWARDNFSRQGGLLNTGRWVSVSTSTQKRKSKMGYGSKTLVASGRQLRPSLNSRFTSRAAYVGWSSELAIYHGSDKPRSKMPLRRLLPNTKEVMPRLIQDLQAFYKKIINRSGFKVRQS